jgi:hypothetical protein
LRLPTAWNAEERGRVTDVVKLAMLVAWEPGLDRDSPACGSGRLRYQWRWLFDVVKSQKN